MTASDLPTNDRIENAQAEWDHLAWYKRLWYWVVSAW
jgi:hypothetical protein